MRDWKSEEFKRIVESVVGKPPSYQQGQMRELAEFLDKHWETEYKHYLEAQIYDEKNEKYLDSTTASSFQKFLVQQAWLPCDQLGHVDATKFLFSGHELFDNARHVRNLLHSHVPYIGAELKNEDFVSRLGIKRNVSKDDVIKHLMKWSQETSESDTPFRTSIEHMSHVYVFLKQGSEDYSILHSSDKVYSENLIEKFREEKLVYVPDTFEDFSASVDVPGHFETIHSVCWKDPSSVLYTRQKYSLPLSPHLPKVLSLYYITRNDQSMTSQVQQAFVHFGVPEAPRVASYLTLLKFISTLSHHPEPEHVKDFTSIAFELVRLCKEDSNVHPDFVYSNLKNGKIFPTESRMWVSLQECLLENDDKNIAKCFQKSDKVFFILWPDNIVGRKKSRDTSKQQNLANQEARDSFINICKIPKLSAVAAPKVDYGGEARPVDKVSAQLSNWISIIQQFIATSCTDLYISLKENNIQDKLHRLQVLSVIQLSCRYFVDHADSRIASPGDIQKSCEYCYDGDTSTIYIAADKVEKPSCLLPALMKLFSQSSSGQEFSNIEDFLKDLLLNCPMTKGELGELAEDYSVECLPCDEPVWEIPLLKHQQSVETEGNSTDEETDMSTEEEEEETKPDSRGMESMEEEKRLTSWPPRAAVDRSDTAPRHVNRISAPSGEPGFDQNLSHSVIGEEELREARKKHLEGYTESSVDPEEHPRKIPRIEEFATPSDIATESGNVYPPPHRDSIVQGNTRSFPDESRVLSEQKQSRAPFISEGSHGTFQDNPPEMKANEIESEQDRNEPKRKFHTNDSQTHRNHPEDSKWTALQRLDSEIELVDIQAFVRKAERADAVPLVESLEDVSLDDEETRTKIGRWGERYVFIILQKKGHLPDGSQIRSISWVNEDEETDKPFDIVVELESDTQQSRTVYIEVKSTAADEKELVSISWTQLKFAEDHRENFHLYRVYSAGRQQSRLCMLENLCGYIKDHRIRFSFVL